MSNCNLIGMETMVIFINFFSVPFIIIGYYIWEGYLSRFKWHTAYEDSYEVNSIQSNNKISHAFMPLHSRWVNSNHFNEVQQFRCFNFQIKRNR